MSDNRFTLVKMNITRSRQNQQLQPVSHEHLFHVLNFKLHAHHLLSVCNSGKTELCNSLSPFCSLTKVENSKNLQAWLISIMCGTLARVCRVQPRTRLLCTNYAQI